MFCVHLIKIKNLQSLTLLPYQDNTNISNELELKDTPITEFLAHEGYVSELVFFNSNQIITSSEDKSIKL